MPLRRVSLKEIQKFEKFDEEGGLGTMHIIPPDKLAKVYIFGNPEEATEMSKHLEAIGSDFNLYNGLKIFCAIPEVLVEKEDNHQIVGFQMHHFKDFEPLGRLLDKDYCVRNKVTIRKVVNIFLTLHDYLRKIHDRGFIVGDMSENNFLFKFVEKTVHLAFVDVDSWAVRRPNLNLPAMARTLTFCHPEIEDDLSKLQAYHDWYSYTVLLARSLVKNDPFNLGGLDDATMKVVRGTSQEKGITCWDSRVRLTNEEILFVRRFGTNLTGTLQTWLQGNQRNAFPKEVLEDFLDGLAFCKKCKLEVHVDHVRCKRCGEKLIPPIPRAKRNPSSVPLIPDFTADDTTGYRLKRAVDNLKSFGG